MRAPEFWARRGPAAWALAPVATLYGLGARLRRALARPRTAAVPVICAGNLTVGGAGKTPTALALAALLREQGVRPHFLTRGYGGRLAGPVRVDLALHGADDVGDEPLLLAEAAPCWVSRDRAAGAEAAVAAGAEAIVMDDGFQNPSLHKTLSFVVVDGTAGLGNRMVLPAGPLRERIADGMARAGAVILVEPASDAVRRDVAAAARGLPVLGARFVLEREVTEALRDRAVVAFAGLARPEKFFQSLREAGCRLATAEAYPDHHRYTAEELAGLRRRAAEADALLATTAKDHVRLAPGDRTGVVRVGGRLAFAAPDRVLALLASARDGPAPRVSRGRASS